MKKLLLAFLLILVMGSSGFALGWFYLSRPPAEAGMDDQDDATERTVVYKMPLGEFTFQVLQPNRILHIVIDMDVFISEVAAYEELGSKGGRARLRDTTITAVSDMAETTLWVDEGEEDSLDKATLARQIVLQLNKSFSPVKSARINQFHVSSAPRD